MTERTRRRRRTTMRSHRSSAAPSSVAATTWADTAGAARRTKRAGGATSAHRPLWTTASSLFLLLLPFVQGYFGPQKCPTSSSKGYSNYNSLLFDLLSVSLQYSNGRPLDDSQLIYNICPDTVLDLDDTQLPLQSIPIRVPGTQLICGGDHINGEGGGREDNCILQGGSGSSQIYVYPSAYDVTLRGLQFTRTRPTHFAAVAVSAPSQRPLVQMLTVEDCVFQNVVGYGIIVVPGLQQPAIKPRPPCPWGVNACDDLPDDEALVGPGVNPSGGEQPQGNNATQVSPSQGGQGQESGNDPSDEGPTDSGDQEPAENGRVVVDGDPNRKERRLLVSEKHVTVVGCDFIDNVANQDVTGLVTSSYSLQLSKNLFQNNQVQTMVFVLEDGSSLDNNDFVQNKVKTATVVLAGGDAADEYRLSKNCFLGSDVGLTNVLLTSDDPSLIQLDNHATDTDFTWMSSCQGAVRESDGHDCLGSTNCNGTCVAFGSGECLSDRSLTNGAIAMEGGSGAFVLGAVASLIGSWLFL